jgi:hypothetical protein
VGNGREGSSAALVSGTVITDRGAFALNGWGLPWSLGLGESWPLGFGDPWTGEGPACCPSVGFGPAKLLTSEYISCSVILCPELETSCGYPDFALPAS